MLKNSIASLASDTSILSFSFNLAIDFATLIIVSRVLLDLNNGFDLSDCVVELHI